MRIIEPEPEDKKKDPLASGESRNSIDQYQTLLPPILDQSRPSLAALQDKHQKEERRRA